MSLSMPIVNEIGGFNFGKWPYTLIDHRFIVVLLSLGTDSMVSEYIDSHYTDIVDKLDLRIRNQLYQSKILVNPDQLDAIAMAENAFQRSQGIKMILDAVKANGFGGVMALVAAIKADSGSDESDDHYALLQSLTNDSVYATLKTCWIRTVTDQFCAS